jgi:hypothetical protein
MIAVTKQPAKLDKLIEDIGLKKFSEPFRFYTFINEGISQVRFSLSGEDMPKFAHDPSCIPAALKKPESETMTLEIDIGGTHTKAGICRTDKKGDKNWIFLFDQDNSDFQDESLQGKPIEIFFSVLSDKIISAINQQNLSLESINGLGAVWSNGIECRGLSSGGVKGITGIVSGIGEGSYRKNEWFIKDLKNGDDIGGRLLNVLKSKGIEPQAFVIGNDTPLTAAAASGSHAGMVASTGANATNTYENFMYNTEMGGRYVIPAAAVSEGDEYYSNITENKITLQTLMSGMGLAAIFNGSIKALHRKGAGNFDIIEDCFDNDDLSLLLSNKNREFKEFLEKHDFCSIEMAADLYTLAQAIIERAGDAAAAMAYFSVCNQLEDYFTNNCQISLDSKMAHVMPGYFERMQNTLNTIVAERHPGKSVQVVLCENIGKITVPMQGLTRVIEHFLSE